MGLLTNYRRNIHSENGEDGIVEELLKRLGLWKNGSLRWCVEFGEQGMAKH
jgi:hypothetical protein